MRQSSCKNRVVESQHYRVYKRMLEPRKLPEAGGIAIPSLNRSRSNGGDDQALVSYLRKTAEYSETQLFLFHFLLSSFYSLHISPGNDCPTRRECPPRLPSCPQRVIAHKQHDNTIYTVLNAHSSLSSPFSFSFPIRFRIRVYALLSRTHYAC